jgi:hypothetical protein
MEFQNMVLPNNPCVEDSMIDFVAGGSIATASDRQLPKVKSSKSHSSTRQNQKKPKGGVQLKTTTTTSTTTAEPSPEETEVVQEEEEEIVSTEDTSFNEVDEEEVKETDKNATSTSKSSEKEHKPATTVPSEIRTKVPSKGVKVSTKSGTSTAKVISGQPLVTQTPPPKEGYFDLWDGK